ncbi:unnamed protein product [Absidia cylindrospora]
MASTTYFHTVSRSYTNVETAKGVDTDQFLEATEGVVKLFDSLGSSAFTVKIRTRYLSNPTANDTLENLVANEANEKKRVATEGLLWLIRGLDFTAQALRRSLTDQAEELTVSFTKSYEATLKKFHGYLVRPVFSLAMKACPYRKDFYAKINVQNDEDKAVMSGWLAALETIIATIQAVFVAHPEYIKGM